jgi:hypothetical protein
VVAVVDSAEAVAAFVVVVDFVEEAFVVVVEVFE